MNGDNGKRPHQAQPDETAAPRGRQPDAPTDAAPEVAPRPDRSHAKELAIGAGLVIVVGAMVVLSYCSRGRSETTRVVRSATQPAISPEALLREAQAAAEREASKRQAQLRARVLAERRRQDDAARRMRAIIAQQARHPRRPPPAATRTPQTSRFRTLVPGSSAGANARAPDPADASGAVPAREAELERVLARLRRSDGSSDALPQPATPAQRRAVPRYRPVAAQLYRPRHVFLRAGTVIPATLLTHVSSQAPGPVQAVVSHHVYAASGSRDLIIPAGTRLLGQASGRPQLGDRRLDVAWNRLHFADGTTLILDRTRTVDGRGTAGVEDRVNNRWASFYAHAFLTSLTGAAAQLSQGRGARGVDSGSRGEDAAAALGRNLSEVTRQVAERNLRRPPVIEVRAGHAVAVTLLEDLVFGEDGDAEESDTPGTSFVE